MRRPSWLRFSILLLVLGACRPDAGPPGNVLIWARGSDSSTLDPAAAEWTEEAKVLQSVCETLLTFKEDSTEIEGRLATSWKFSGDGKGITLDLRTGVLFHDGTPFNAEAVVFTFRRLLDRSHPQKPKDVPYLANFEIIEKVEAAGPSAVTFTLRRPSAVILSLLSLFGGAIVSPDAVRKHGDRFNQNPVGTGPYRFVRWDRDVKIELEAFPGYWGRKPPIPRIIVVPVQSPQTAIQKLRKGEVHVVDHPTLADVKALEGDPALRIDTETSLNICYLTFNMKKAPYDNLHFRRAVALALDRRVLNELAYYGLAEPASNVVPPALWKGHAPAPPYEYDLEKAREELEKAKLASRQVELIHMTYSRPYVPEPQRVAEFVKDQLRKIGLEVRLSGYDKNAYTLLYKQDDHPMCLLGWNADYADPDNFFFPLLHGRSSGDLNASFFNDREFNGAVERAQSETDPGARRALYAKAYERYRAELPTVPLVHVKQVIAMSSKVRYDMHPIEYRLYAASFAK